jgi:hypothetical protein
MNQEEIVLKYMKEHGSITTLEAAVLLYIMDLQSVIRNLRKEYNIKDEWIVKTNLYGKKVKFKKYRIEEN